MLVNLPFSGLVTEHAISRKQFGKHLREFGLIQVNFTCNKYAFQKDAYRPLQWPPLDVRWGGGGGGGALFSVGGGGFVLW